MLLLIGIPLHAQELQAVLTEKNKLDAEHFYGVDEFGAVFYSKENVLYKKNSEGTLSYQHINLGKLTSVSIQNPLKIILFYKDFNSIVILDNRLNELLDPVTVQKFNVALVGYAPENNVWLYSEDFNTLQLFDYFTQKINLQTQPLGFYQKDFFAKELIADNDKVWLTGKKGILLFNQYASYIDYFYFSEISKLQPYKEGFFFLQEKTLHFFDGAEVYKVNLTFDKNPESYFIRYGKLYVFSGNMLTTYTIKE